ncbi:MAG: WD40 repeat domain-containing protein, partial [Planctomycetes bacterium]|nr:WD40 repeat domain-containing protein [Planctomycetota bacterium]
QNIFVKEMTLSADGLTLATAGSDNLVKVWDVETGRELRVLRGHTATVSQLCLSADGSTLVSGDVNGWVKVWMTDPNAETNVLTHEGLIVYTAVAPEGDLLAATNSNFFAVDLWDLRSRTATRIINDAKAEVAFSPDGKWRALRTFSKPYKVELWDRSTTLEGPDQDLSCAMAIGYQLRFSPDSRILVFRAPGESNEPNSLQLWDIDASKSLGQLPDMTEICGTAFSSAGELIATGTDGRIRIWDVRSQTLLAEIEDQYKQIRSLCFSADDIMLIAASGNADVRRWDVTDLEHPQELSPLRGHTAFVNQIALSPDGKTLASGGDDSTLRLWDPLSGEELVTLRAHSSIIQCLAWSPDGQTLYTGSGDATVRIWHAPSWEEIEAAEQADEDPDR